MEDPRYVGCIERLKFMGSVNQVGGGFTHLESAIPTDLGT